MKKGRFLFVLTILAVVVFSITLVGCTNNSNPDKAEATVTLSSISIEGPTEITVDDFDIANYKIKTTFSDASTGEVALTNEMISNSDKILLEEVGKHNITITYNGKTTVLSINVLAKDFSDIKFEDTTIEYDGKYHGLVVENLPENTVVTFDTDNQYKEIGEYTVTATIKNPKYNTITKTATLIIDKITYDMSKVVFEDTTIEYDGDVHSIYATNLPEGVTVEYINNGQTEIGKYLITAKFKGDEIYHKTIEDKTVMLTIKKAVYDMSNVVFEDASFKYDGKQHNIYATNLPEGVKVEYVNNGKTEIGEYIVTAKFTGDDKHELISDMIANLYITTADISNIKFVDKVVKFDGASHKIEITGELPEGVFVKYDNNTHTNIGKYVAKATFTDANGNSVGLPILEANLIIVEHDLEGITFDNQTIEYDGKSHSIAINGELPKDVYVKYDNNNKTLAGDYIVTAKFVNSKGELIGYPDKEATLTISKRKSKVNFEGTTDLVYNGTVQKTVSATLSRILPTDIVNVTLTYSGEMIEAGEYTVTATIDNPNYALENSTTTVNITRANHNVIFKQQGYEDIVVVVKDLASLDISTVQNPQTVEGYDVEWDTSSVDLSCITTDIIINIAKTPIKYKITYDLKGGINNLNNPTEYTIESENIFLYEPTKAQSTFNGWYKKEYVSVENKISYIPTGSTGNITIFANWLTYKIESAEGFEIVTEPELCIITTVPNKVANIDLNSKITVSDGCKWSLFRDFEGNNELKLKAMSLDIGINEAYIIVFHPDGEHFSRYKLQIYRLDIKSYSFMANGEVYNSGTIEELSTVEAPKINPERTAYTFGGWSVNGEKVEFPYPVIINTTFNAIWNPISYNIKYNLNGGSLTGETTAYTVEDLVIFTEPTREHYTFAGWYDNAELNGKAVTGLSIGNYEDKEYFAKWIPVEYTITLDANGGNLTGNNLINYNIETPTFDLEIPTKAGYTFVGWYEDLQSLDSISKIVIGTTGNKILHAKWQANQNILHFDGNGATSGNMLDMLVNTDETTTLTVNSFIRLGYTFIGWSTTSNGVVEYNDNGSYTMGTDIEYTLYAVWQANLNTLHFDANTGTGEMQDMSIHTDETKTLTANAFIKKGYKFIGWSTTNNGGVEYRDNGSYKMGTDTEYTLYAVWQIVNYNIIYNLNGGTASNPETYNIETETFVLNNPVKAGYTFAGWTYNGQIEPTKNASITKGSIGDRIYTANWEIVTYNITYTLNDGILAEKPLTYTVLDTIDLTKLNPTKEYYNFTEWQKDGVKIETITDSAEDITLCAIFTPIEYTINYALDGGKNNISNPATYNVEDKVVLSNPTKYGYKFIKWQIDGVDTNTINTGSYGEKTATAVWELVTYTITYNLNGGTLIDKPLTYTVEDVINLSTLKPLKENYDFIMWQKDGVKIETITDSAEDITLNAIYKLTEYTINYVLDGGKNNASNPATYNIEDEVILSNPTRLGYKFIKWQIDGIDTNTINTGSYGEKTATVVWELVTYTITYNLNGGINNEQNKSTFTVNDLSSPIPLYNATKAKMFFAGWYTDSKFSNKIDSITECKNYVLYAKFITYTPGLQFAKSSDNTYYSISGYTGTDTEVFIPAKYNGLPVTNISNNAFSGESNVTFIKIPDSVTSIGEYAFYECSSLTSITLLESVTSIGNEAFLGCGRLTRVDITDLTAWLNIDFGSYDANPLSYSHKLYLNGELVTEVTIPQGTTEITPYAFSGCSSLTSITIPSSVTSIGAGAFFGCSSLTSITIPEGLTSIGFKAFESCNSLTSIVIPSSVTNIESYAFIGCSSLKIYCEVPSKPKGWSYNWNPDVPVVWGHNNITTYNEYDYVIHDNKVYLTKYKGINTDVNIPNQIDGMDVVNIGGIFSGNTLITSIVITSSVTSIGDYAFYGCSSLTSITIPEGVTSIGEWTFIGCSILTSITIPTSVTSIGEHAFYECSSLTSITIPEGVTSIGGHAFSGCSSLTSITIPKGVTSIGDRVFQGCSSLTSITIPSSVTSIEYSAFSGCSSLTSITIPESVTSIGIYAFSGCSSLTSITIPESVTSIGIYAFSGCRSLTIYCEAPRKPDSWHTDWNDSNCPVVYYGCTGEDITYSFDTGLGTKIEPITSNGIIDLTNISSTQEGKVLSGWYDNPECTGNAVAPMYYSKTNKTLYAKWEDCTNIEVGTPQTIDIARAGEYKYFKFTPTETRSYTIATNNACDSCNYIYDENQKQLTATDSESFTYTLEAGKTYYIATRLYYSSSTGTYTITIS